jgi:hypothetical protein
MDDNTRIKAGKRCTKTRQKIKKQIRLLTDSLKYLHQKFIFESKSKTSYSLFAKMKYEKQDQQGKAAFNERNPYMTQQQEPMARSPGGPQT